MDLPTHTEPCVRYLLGVVDAGRDAEQLTPSDEPGEHADNLDIDLGEIEIDVDELVEPEDPDDGPPDLILESDAGVETDVSVDGDPTDRDARAREYDGDAPAAKIRERLRQTGLAEDVRDELDDISTTELDSTAPEGPVLDMRNAMRLVSGDTTIRDVKRRREPYPGDDVAVAVSIDQSGSMTGDELEAKAAVGAFLFGVQQLGGEVVANAWHTRNDPNVKLLTGPRERFRWKHLEAVQPGGGDPIGRGLYECASLLQHVRADEKLLIAVTDGRPTIRSLEAYSLGSPEEEATHVVDRCRQSGIAVVGFGFGNVDEETLVEMFGEDGARHVDLEDLAAELVDCYEEQIGPKRRAV